MKKFNYYVGVCTGDKIVLVTSTGPHFTAQWNISKKPEAFSQQIAKEMVEGLILNGFVAVLITSPLELLAQPCAEEKGGEQ